VKERNCVPKGCCCRGKSRKWGEGERQWCSHQKDVEEGGGG
jgi:hypothetical protein